MSALENIGVTSRLSLLRMGNLMDYIPGKTPPDYYCYECGVFNCKLWRPSSTFSIELLCIDCLCKKKEISRDIIDEQGCIEDEYVGKTDQIASYLPAIPADHGFYWYTAVPAEGVTWWKSIDTFPKNFKERCDGCGGLTEDGKQKWRNRSKRNSIYNTDLSKPLHELMQDLRKQVSNVRGQLGDIRRAYGWDDQIEHIEGLLTCGLIAMQYTADKWNRFEQKTKEEQYCTCPSKSTGACLKPGVVDGKCSECGLRVKGAQ